MTGFSSRCSMFICKVSCKLDSHTFRITTFKVERFYLSSFIRNKLVICSRFRMEIILSNVSAWPLKQAVMVSNNEEKNPVAPYFGNTQIKCWRLFIQCLLYLEQPPSISPAGEFRHERVLHSPLMVLFNQILAFLNIKWFGNVATISFRTFCHWLFTIYQKVSEISVGM